MFQNLKSKLAVVALVPFAASSAFAGDLTAAATAATTAITGAIPDAVTILGGMMGLGVAIWAGRKAVGLFGR